MHPSIDLDRCQGHGKCYLVASSLFTPIADDDWGRAELRVSELSDDDERVGALELAIESCPEQAIDRGAPQR